MKSRKSPYFLRHLDLTGFRNAKIEVIEPTWESGKKKWKYKCLYPDCGTIKLGSASDIYYGKIVSCGKHFDERNRAIFTTHGMGQAGSRRSREYNAYYNMLGKARQSGISVCRRWKRSFEIFLADLGNVPTENHKLRLIKRQLGYKPGNCEWYSTVDPLIAGRKFGLLTAMKPATIDNRLAWECECDCGATRIIRQSRLLSTKRPLCCSLDVHPELRPSTHGETRNGKWSPEYSVWSSMIQRCTNHRNPKFAEYGANNRGVCKKWKSSFSAFLNDMGRRPSGLHSLERKNNSRGYCKSNCVWATAIEQARNKTNSHIIRFNGESLCVSEWGRKTGIPQRTITNRIYNLGWSTRRALTTPVRKASLGAKAKTERQKMWNVWDAMIRRCHNPDANGYDRYGANGIRVCLRWRRSFAAFIEDMGMRPSSEFTVERKNPRGHYTKENCKWATKAEQSRNKTNSRILVWRGRSMNMCDWAKETGLSASIIHARLKHGWPVDKALATAKRSV